MAYQKSMPLLLLVKCSHYSLAAVQPFKVGLQFQISSHQAAALTEDKSVAAEFCARPAENYSTPTSSSVGRQRRTMTPSAQGQPQSSRNQTAPNLV
jgi:hypothetical protein